MTTPTPAPALTDEQRTYADAVAAVDDWDRRIAAHTREYEDAIKIMRARRAAAQEIIRFAEAGGNAADYEVARDTLVIGWARHPGRGQRVGDYPLTGPVRVTPEVIGALGDAIEDLRRGCPGLTREQFGVKEYDRWTSQRSDHAYGYGPKHGHLWFAVGLRQPREIPDESTRLACVRYLTAIRDDPALMGGVS